MLVRDRMSAPAVSIGPDTVFRDALKLMHHRRFRRLPVVDDRGRLVGIVSERDLAYASPSHGPSLSVWDLNYLLSSVQIREVMTTDLITTTGDTPVEDAARTMADNKVGGLPVVDDKHRVVGVITETDIFKAFVEMFGGGHPGLRLTLQVPERTAVLMELGTAIWDLGGRIVSIGSYSGDVSGSRGLVVKVRNVRKDAVIDVLESLGEHVLDAREMKL